jgi:hypothetical protein
MWRNEILLVDRTTMIVGPLTFYATFHQARTGRGIHGLPKVSCGPAMPNPCTLCERATPQTDLRPFGGWLACRAGGLWPSSSPLDTPRRTGLPFIVPQPWSPNVSCHFHVVIIRCSRNQQKSKKLTWGRTWGGTWGRTCVQK